MERLGYRSPAEYEALYDGQEAQAVGPDSNPGAAGETGAVHLADLLALGAATRGFFRDPAQRVGPRRARFRHAQRMDEGVRPAHDESTLSTNGRKPIDGRSLERIISD